MNFTCEQDQRIRELYQPPYVRGKIAQQARQWNCKCSQVTHRARQLGVKHLLQRQSVRRWTKPEILLVRQNAHLTHEQLSQLLASSGYTRTSHAIDAFRFREGWRSGCERDEMTVGYTSQGLAKILGVWNSTVLRWIRLGWLKAQPEGGKEHCATYRIHHQELYKFLVTYVHYWNPAKVDKYWLIDVLTRANQRKLK